MDTVVLACTIVLGGVVGDSVANGGVGRDDHVIQLHRGCIAGHNATSESVDDTLDNDVAYRDEALL